MSKNAPTPGPWIFYNSRLSASENHPGFSIAAAPTVGRLHACVIANVVPMDEDGNEGEANARVMSAARDMYTALKRMEQIEHEADSLRGSGMVDHSDIKAIRAMAKIAREALAKAEG